jgi:hypothetical protein
VKITIRPPDEAMESTAKAAADAAMELRGDDMREMAAMVREASAEDAAWIMAMVIAGASLTISEALAVCAVRLDELGDPVVSIVVISPDGTELAMPLPWYPGQGSQ